MSERNLLVKLLGDASDVVKSFKETETKADSMGTKLGSLGAKVAAGVAAVGVAAVAFGVDSVKAFSTAAAAVDDLQDVTGESAESMSRLRYAFNSWGVSDEEMQKAMLKLSKTVGSNNEAFDKYGIAIKDAQGNTLPMSEIVGNAADVFANMPDGIEKSNLAMTLFGKSGTDLLDVMNEGKDGLSALGDEADKYGITIGDKGVAAQQANARSQRQMHAAMEGLKIQIGEKLMPIVAKLTSWMAENLPVAIDFAKRAATALGPAFNVLGDIIAGVADVIASMVTWLMDHKEVLIGLGVVVGTVLVAAFVAWAASAIAAAAATVLAAAPVIALGLALGALVAGVIYAYQNFDWFRDSITAVKNFIVDDLVPAFQAIWSFISDNILPIIKTLVEDYIKVLVVEWRILSTFITDVVVPAFMAIYNTIVSVGTKVGEVVDSIVGFVTGIPDRISDTISTLWDGLTGGITAAKDWVSDRVDEIVGYATGLPGRMLGLFDGMWDGIKDAFRTAINWVIDGINAVKLPGITIGGWNTHIPGVGSLPSFTTPTIDPFPNIARLHSGGIIPGLAGSEQLVLARAGERMQTQGQANADRGGGMQIVNHWNGITDQRTQARLQAREVGWMLRSA